jgi:hypothetical protein
MIGSSTRRACFYAQKHAKRPEKWLAMRLEVSKLCDKGTFERYRVGSGGGSVGIEITACSMLVMLLR